MNEERLEAIERRLALLESRTERETAAPRPATNDLTEVMHGWRRRAEERSGPGTVGYAGAVNLAGDLYQWARETSLDELPADWSQAVGLLESLASKPRLELIGALARGGRRLTSAELLEVLGGEEGETTSGQLYHHLRALQAANLIKQSRRGTYDLAPGALIAILTIVTAALNHTTDFSFDPLAGIPEAP